MLLHHRVTLVPHGHRRTNSVCHPIPTSARPAPLVILGRGQRHHQNSCRAVPTETLQHVVVEAPEQPTLTLESIDDGSYPHADDGTGPGPSPRHDVCAPEVSFVSLVNGKFTVRGRMLLPVPASRVYDLLTDYSSCHRVFSNIAASEVVAAGPEGALEVVQSCRWSFLAFSGTFRVHLGVRPDPASRTLLFTLVQSSFMRDFEGRWAVRPLDRASASPGGSGAGGQPGVDEAGQWCEVEHQLSVVPSVPVPPPVSYYTRGIFVRQVEGILNDLRRGVMATDEAADAGGCN